MIDIERTRRRVVGVLDRAGSHAWLVGYDANGIQELITASSRPIAMLGASTTIARLDEAALRDGAIFAGGGRGVELVASEQDAQRRAEKIVTEFRRVTVGGVMATAYVPYDRAAPAQSVRWLRRKLECQKDAASPLGGDIPTEKHEHCADCRAYGGTRPSRRRDAQGEMVCVRCDEMVTAGRARSHDIDERIQSLVDLSPATGRVAAVSVDGNDLGDFFARLETLEELAVASEAISIVFREAHEDALRRIARDKISLATGGDDIRLFLAPEDLFDYVGALVPAIELRANALRDLDDAFAGLEALGVGVGVGAVVADARLPAARLMAHAHELERNAKRVCRPAVKGEGGAPRTRSAFDFAVLTAGEASFGSLEQRGQDDGRPIPMTSTHWERVHALAGALRDVPRAQRAVLGQAGLLSQEELDNLFRYQVARSRSWQDWYKAAGIDWRNADAVVRHRPQQVHVDILRAISSAGSGAS